MPQGQFKKHKLANSKPSHSSKASKTKKGRVVKPPKRLAAKRKLEMETAVDRTLRKRTERRTAAMVMKEGTKLKVLDVPPVLRPKKK